MRLNSDTEPPAGSQDATRFLDTVVPCIEQIRGRARRLTANPYDAEDLIQETMLKAYSGFHSFQADSNARAWLFRIMYNNWINTYRARQRGVAEQLCEDFTDWQLSAEARHTSSGLRSAEVEALETMRDDEIADALSAIPAVNRVTVYLADVEGYPYREIASLMGTPIGTVMSRLARGRRRLRELLNDVAKDRGIIRVPADGPGPLPQSTR